MLNRAALTGPIGGGVPMEAGAPPEDAVRGEVQGYTARYRSMHLAPIGIDRAYLPSLGCPVEYKHIYIYIYI